jgi:eukaryotic-like serine/threonine-protein kinase
MAELSPLPPHALTGLLGEGGMATVHAARDTTLDRPVALKVLRTELCADPGVVARFMGEARLVASLEHPNILPVHAAGAGPDGRPTLSMKVTPGGSLHDRMRGSRLPPKGDEIDDLVDVLIGVCDALGMAHARGWVHGDLKAQNVLLGEHGAVYLVDWGNARPVGSPPPRDAAGAPLLLGTPAVMAPEQARGDAVDARTDVFGVGALLYTLLARRVPYGRGGPQARIDAARVGRRKPLEQAARRAPAGLRAIAERAMSLDPTDRHADIGALRSALLAWRRRSLVVPLRTLGPGEVLITEGDGPGAMYVLESGQLVVSTGEGEARRALRTCSPGELIGEISLFAGLPRTATLTAVGTATVREVTPEMVDEQLSRVSPWVRAAFEALARSLHQKLQDDPSLSRG